METLRGIVSLLSRLLPLRVETGDDDDGRGQPPNPQPPNDGTVPIDAKFPLADFQNLLAAQDQTQRQKARSAFLRQVKNHIDAIAEKYIRPA